MATSSPARDFDDNDDDPLYEPSAPDATGSVESTGDSTSMFGQFTWTVALPAAPADKDSLADISKIRQFSDVFEVGGFEWKLEMYPYGDSQSDKTLSVFLCAVDRKQLPGWSQTAHYQITVVNKDLPKSSTHTGYDIFRGKRDSAWGWSKLISLSKLHDPAQGWVDDGGNITIQATVHVVTHDYMPVNRTYRKSLCGLYYERVLQSYFEPFLKDELLRLDKLCGNSALHKGFSDFWVALPDANKRELLQITLDEVLLNVKARLFSRDQPATYLAADVIFKAAQDCSQTSAVESVQQTVVGNTSLSIVCGGEGTVLRLERVNSDKNAGSSTSAKSAEKALASESVDSEVKALVKHLKPQSCDGTCLEAMGRQMLAVFAMCGMYITNVHPSYHEKLALQLQEDLIREEEEKNLKAQAKKAKQAEKKKKQQEMKAQKRAEEEAAKKKAEEEERKKKEEEKEERRKREEEAARKKAEAKRLAQEEAERKRRLELEVEEKRKKEEAERKREEAEKKREAAEKKREAAEKKREAEEKKREAEERKQREEAERKAREQEAAARQAAIDREREKAAAEKEDADEVPYEEQLKRKEIAAIMRNSSLSPQEKQARVQAILAGKVDVTKSAAMHVSSVQEVTQEESTAPEKNVAAQAEKSTQRVHVEPAPFSVGSRADFPPSIPFNPLAMDSSADVDVEAVALQALEGFGGDDIMSIALGSMSAPSNTWSFGQQEYAPDNNKSFQVPFAQNPASAQGAAGSRLFEKWSGKGHSAHDNSVHSNHCNGNMMFHNNGFDSEENEASIASTASGTRTPLSFDVDFTEASSPELSKIDGNYMSHVSGDWGADSSQPSKRRQICLLLAYIGNDFQGGLSHQNPSVRTVEGELLKVLRASGALNPDPSLSSLEKIGWTHACLTEPGVHASGQCVTVDIVKPRESLATFIERLNARLTGDLRILNCTVFGNSNNNSFGPSGAKVNGSKFDAGNLALCSFEYVIPSALFCVFPSRILNSGGAAVYEYLRQFRISAVREQQLNYILRQFQTGGVRGLQWFQEQWDFSLFTDKSFANLALGSIKSFCIAEKLVVNGIEHLVLRVEGMNFFPGQVMKMVGLSVLTLCRKPESTDLSTLLQEAVSNPFAIQSLSPFLILLLKPLLCFSMTRWCSPDPHPQSASS
eukprot:757289-Hanusia_phi.AAC.2